MRVGSRSATKRELGRRNPVNRPAHHDVAAVFVPPGPLALRAGHLLGQYFNWIDGEPRTAGAIKHLGRFAIEATRR